MRKATIWWITTACLINLCLSLAGCFSSSAPLSPQVPAPQTAGQLLAASGFKQIYPNTPAQQARLRNMPQKQIFLISKGPKVY